MKCKVTTYRTLIGTKEIVEPSIKKTTQWVVYQDNKPKFFIDFFDLEEESNVMMNSLVLCAKRTIGEVLIIINKRNNVNLSIPKVSRLGIKVNSEYKVLNLQPLPEEWLDYSF
jgi:hypothetical protein